MCDGCDAPPMAMDIVECRACKEKRYAFEFQKNSKGFLRGECSSCRKERFKSWTERNFPKSPKVSRKRAKQNFNGRF